MPNPQEGGIQLSRNKIWSKNTGRDSTGEMVGTIIAIKDKLEIVWADLAQEEAGLIDDIVSDPNKPFTMVEFIAVNGSKKTVKAYFGDPVYGVEAYKKGKQVYNNVSVSTIQK